MIPNGTSKVVIDNNKVPQPSTDVIVSEGANINVTNGDSAISLESDNIQDFINKGNVSIKTDKGQGGSVNGVYVTRNMRSFVNGKEKSIEAVSSQSVAIGVRIESDVESFINDGAIIAKSTESKGYGNGIYLDYANMLNFRNNGVIYAESALADSSYSFSATNIDGGSNIADFQNTGNLLYKGKNGSQLSVSEGNVEITHWDVKINDLRTFNDLNSLKDGNTTDGKTNNRPDKIVLNFDKAYGKIAFGQGAIKISVGEDFELGKSYNLKNIVVKNANGIILSAYDDLKLSKNHFADGNTNDMIYFDFITTPNNIIPKKFHWNVDNKGEKENLIISDNKTSVKNEIDSNNVASLTITEKGSVGNLTLTPKGGNLVIKSIDNNGTISSLVNNGTITTLNNSGTISKITKLGNIGTFNNKATSTLKSVTIQKDDKVDNFSNEIEMTDFTNNSNKAIVSFTNGVNGITTLSNNGTISSLVNNGTITTLNNSGTISKITTLGTIKDFINNGIIKSSVVNETNKTMNKFLNNEKGIIIGDKYAVHNKGVITDFINQGQLLFKDKIGSQLHNETNGKVTISRWDVEIGSVFKPLNELNNALINGNTNNDATNLLADRIILSGDLKGIQFKDKSIYVKATSNKLELNKEYSLSDIVAKNTNEKLESAYKDLNLSASNFISDKNSLIELTFKDDKFHSDKYIPPKPNPNPDQGGGDGDKPKPPKPNPNPDQGGGDGDKPKPESGEVSAVVKVNTKKALSNTVNKGIVTSDTQKTTYIDGVISNAIDGALNRGQFKVTNNDYFNLESKNRYASVESDAIVYDEVKGANAMKHYTYLIPYANHTKVNTDFGDNKSDAFGLVGGYQQDLGDNGVLGFYLGYQRDDVDGVLGLTYTNDTFLLGINHYKTLSQKGNLELYTKAIVSMDFSTMDLERKDSENTKIDKANTNNFGFGGTFALGGNYYLDNMGSIDTSAFVGYKRMNLGSYSIGQEHYHKTNMNLFTAGANIEWFKQFDNHIFVSTQGGVRFNLNRDIETNITIYNNNITGKNKLPSTFGHIQGEIGYAFNESLSTSITYNYQVAKDTQSHTGNVKVGYRW